MAGIGLFRSFPIVVIGSVGVCVCVCVCVCVVFLRTPPTVIRDICNVQEFQDRKLL